MKSSPAYSLKDERGAKEARSLLPIHEAFFKEGAYRNLTFMPEKTYDTILAMMSNSDFYYLVARDESGEPCGWFNFAFENPWMAEEVMLCVNFYVASEHRRGLCSQLMMDMAIKICQDRGAKLVWMSSTAGFSDNGCNERAFRMFLKRNRFRECGTFLVWEPNHEQIQEGA